MSIESQDDSFNIKEQASDFARSFISTLVQKPGKAILQFDSKDRADNFEKSSTELLDNYFGKKIQSGSTNTVDEKMTKAQIAGEAIAQMAIVASLALGWKVLGPHVQNKFKDGKGILKSPLEATIVKAKPVDNTDSLFGLSKSDALGIGAIYGGILYPSSSSRGDANFTFERLAGAGQGALAVGIINSFNPLTSSLKRVGSGSSFFGQEMPILTKLQELKPMARILDAGLAGAFAAGSTELISESLKAFETKGTNEKFSFDKINWNKVQSNAYEGFLTGLALGYGFSSKKQTKLTEK